MWLKKAPKGTIDNGHRPDGTDDQAGADAGSEQEEAMFPLGDKPEQKRYD